MTVTIPGYTVRQTIALLAEKGRQHGEALTEAAQTGDLTTTSSTTNPRT